MTPASFLHENWNRYYDPVPGTYMSSEPLLGMVQGQKSVAGINNDTPPLRGGPRFIRRYAKRGFSVPAYAYALNNPLRFVDRNGLEVPVDMDWLKDVLRSFCQNFIPASMKAYQHKTKGPGKSSTVDYITGNRADCGGSNSQSLGVTGDEFVEAWNQVDECKGIFPEVVTQ